MGLHGAAPLVAKESDMVMVNFNTKAPIKGWDFSEIGDAFGLPDCNDLDEEVYLNLLREALEEVARDDFDGKQSAEPVVSWLRQFLNKLAEEDVSYKTPLFRGIAAITDNFTLLQVVIHCLPLLWS